MDELRTNRLRPHLASEFEAASNLDADISAAFRRIIYELPRRAVEDGWTPEQLASTHDSLRKTEKKLFGTDNFRTKKGNPIRWDPTDIITWGRLLGFKEQVQKHLRVPYDKRWRIQPRHVDRLRLILQERIKGLSHAPEYARHVRSSWLPFLYYVDCEITGQSEPESLLIAEHDKIAPGNHQPKDNGLEDRLSEKLSKVNSTRDVVNLLAGVDHCYEWSIKFRDAFALLSQDKKHEVGHWFYKTVGNLWQAADSTSMHVAIMASGTLTYTAADIDGLREVEIWNNWLEPIIDDLKPEMALIAEPLSYIASIHGKHGSFVKNIHRMIDADPSYRRIDFSERLHYCAGGQAAALTAEARVINVAKNISHHLHNRQFPQILCHDVGRVIEIYPRLIRHSQYLDVAQFIKDATIKALAIIDIKPSLRADVEGLIEGR